MSAILSEGCEVDKPAPVLYVSGEEVSSVTNVHCVLLCLLLKLSCDCPTAI